MPVQETQVRSLGQEDSLEKEMATHSSMLVWRIPWTEEPGGATVHGVAKNQTLLSDFTLLLCIYYMLFCNHLSFIINIITYSTNIDQNYFLQILDFEI